MQDFSEFIDKDDTINNKVVFEKLFTAPKRTFAFIHSHRYDKHLLLISMLTGISSALARATEKNEGDDFPLWGVILFSIIVGCIFGYISLLFYSFITNIAGRWLKGTASTDAILRILAYSMVPSLIKLILFAITIAVFGNAVFSSDFYVGDFGVLSQIIYYGTTLVSLGVGLWSGVLFVIGLAEVQQFSYGKALLNILLPLLVLIAIALVLFVSIDLFGN